MDSSSARGMVLPGILYFIAQKANIVVAPIVVGGDEHGRAQAQEKIVRQGESARRKAEGPAGIEVSESRKDDPAHGDQHPGQKQFRHPADAGDFPIEQDHGENDDPDCHERRPGHQPPQLQGPEQGQMQLPQMVGILVVERGPEVGSVTRQSDGAGSNRERRAEGKLPDKKKGNQSAESARAVDLAQITVRSTRPGHGRAQFRPDQPVAHGEDRAEDPAQHGLRSAHCAHDQRNGDERPHADHVDHVQRGSAADADAADQGRGSVG